MPQVPTKKLNNGITIPMIGTGAGAGLLSTAEVRSQAKNWLLTALNAGFRHIDTASSYGTERATGQAVRESGIPREEIFVTTKLPSNHQHRVVASFNESFENLGLGYIDLYLIHSPQAVFYQEGVPYPKNPDGTVKINDTITFNDSWAEMEKILKTGKVKAIGVSNFSIKTLKELLKTAHIVPAVNQVELHPYLAQNELKQYCDEMGIALTAYTPSGYSSVRNDPLILELATKYGVSPTQVILAWHIARGVVIIPKSVNEERQKENINLPELYSADVGKINGLDRNERICNKADENGQVLGWTYEQLGW